MNVRKIRKFVAKLWSGEEVENITLNSKGCTATITLASEYGPPGLSFSQLKKLSKFFGTENINDDDRFSEVGCETCDYGSSYGFTLTIREITKL